MRKIIFTIFCWALVQSSIAQSIGQRTFHFTDSSRNRPVVTELWYATKDPLKGNDSLKSPFLRDLTVRDGALPEGKFPLIMISHGTGGGRLTLEWLAQALVKKGFLVAAVDHWGNTADNKIPIEFVKPWERPQDISFALRRLLNEPAIKDIIDQSRIGAAGFSLGGYTVLALAGSEIDYNVLVNYYKTNGRKEIETPEMPGTGRFLTDTALLEKMKHVPSLKDKRITSFLAICPALGAGFVKQQQLKNVDHPVFIIGAHSDALAPVKTNAQHFHQLIRGSAYYEFPGGTGHYVMLGEAKDFLKQEEPMFFTDQPDVDRHDVHRKVADIAEGFFRKQL